MTIVAGCAVIAIICVAWRVAPAGPDSVPGGARQANVYEPETWWQVLLFGAAVSLAVPRIRVAALTTAGACALGLAGTGAVAFRRWNTSKGFGATAANLSTLRLLAVVLAVTSLAAAGTCAATLWRRVRRTGARRDLLRVAVWAWRSPCSCRSPWAGRTRATARPKAGPTG